MNNKYIILFIKNPYRGSQIKTRLAKHIGQEKTIRLYQCFILDILETLHQKDYQLWIFYYPSGSSYELIEWLGKKIPFYPQVGKDLGERMQNAFDSGFKKGFDKILLIGSDCPDISLPIFKEAFLSLNKKDAVIGPALDGGYYLIGFKREYFLKEVFQKIEWSTETVYQKTMEIFEKNSYQVHTLSAKRDIDYFEDLKDFYLRNGGKLENSFTMNWLKKNKDILRQ